MDKCKMILPKLVNAFENETNLPIEIPEIASVLVKLGIQDEITFIPSDMNPERLRGIYKQFTYRKTVYGEPVLATYIMYSKHVDLSWQRLICCKEMLHVFDPDSEKTSKPEDIEALCEKILGPLSTDDFGLHDLMAARDKLAVYQAMAVLFPDAARNAALEEMKKGASVTDIAQWAVIPESLCRLVLSENWPDLKAELVSY